jgi:hypothetical protein
VISAAGGWDAVSSINSASCMVLPAVMVFVTPAPIIIFSPSPVVMVLV